MIRIKATLPDGTVYVGPIQGNGGRIGNGALHAGYEAAARDAERTLRRVARLAARGRDTGVYEPKPGHLAIFPEETAEGPGREVVIPIVNTRFEVEPEPKPAGVKTWTTAPESYDGFGTETVRVAGKLRSRDVREVETPPSHVEWQRMRYHSGGIYLVADEGEWQKNVELGLVTISGERELS